MSRANLFPLCATFLNLGATAFGGMWGATEKLRHELVVRRKWLKEEEIPFLLVAATLLPSPKFLGFGGMVGFRLGGWLGSIVSSFSLLLPGATIIILVVTLISPEILSTTLAPVQRAVSVAVIGLLLGQASKLIKSAKTDKLQKIIGLLLCAAVVTLTLAGVPLLAVVAVGFGAGLFLLKEGHPNERSPSIVRDTPRHDA